MAQFMQLGTFDLTDRIYSEIKPTGGGWKVKQDGATSLWTAARKDVPEGTSYTFSVVFGGTTAEDDASEFLTYCYPYGPDSPDFDSEAGADIRLYFRSEDWYYSVWAVVVKPASLSKNPLDYTQYCYDVTCYLYSPYSYADVPSTWTQSSITSLPQTKNISNLDGHIASAFDSLEVTCTYNAAHVKNLIHSTGSTSLTIATEALSDEVWELKGNENIIYETYEDLITSDTKFLRDVTNPGTAHYVTGSPAYGWIEIHTGEKPYYRLSGPNQARIPVKMSAMIYVNSLSDPMTVDISSDAAAWSTVLTHDDLSLQDSVVREFVLNGTEYMSDIYVRFNCITGPIYLGSVKFEVERWVEYGTVPQIAAGATATASVDATTGSEYCNISGEFYPRRMFI